MPSKCNCEKCAADKCRLTETRLLFKAMARMQRKIVDGDREKRILALTIALKQTFEEERKKILGGLMEERSRALRDVGKGHRAAARKMVETAEKGRSAVDEFSQADARAQRRFRKALAVQRAGERDQEAARRAGLARDAEESRKRAAMRIRTDRDAMRPPSRALGFVPDPIVRVEHHKEQDRAPGLRKMPGLSTRAPPAPYVARPRVPDPGYEEEQETIRAIQRIEARTKDLQNIYKTAALESGLRSKRAAESLVWRSNDNVWTCYDPSHGTVFG